MKLSWVFVLQPCGRSLTCVKTLQDCQEDTCLEFFACYRASLEHPWWMRRTDGNQLVCRIREDALNHHRCLGLPIFALALVLCGCTGLPSRAVSGNAEPPAWNSLELMTMDKEIVSADPSGQNTPGSEHASASAIAAPHSSS